MFMSSKFPTYCVDRKLIDIIKKDQIKHILNKKEGKCCVDETNNLILIINI